MSVGDPTAFRGRNSTWPISDTQKKKTPHCARLGTANEKDNIALIVMFIEMHTRCTTEAVEKRALDWRLRDIRKKPAVVANLRTLGRTLKNLEISRSSSRSTE